MNEQNKTLYERLGGYDAIAAVADDLVARINRDPQLGRFWAHRGEDGVKREKQLLIDFLCERAGGPIYYRGREMLLAPPRHEDLRERLECVSRTRPYDPGEVQGAGVRTARCSRVRPEPQERYCRIRVRLTKRLPNGKADSGRGNWRRFEILLRTMRRV